MNEITQCNVNSIKICIYKPAFHDTSPAGEGKVWLGWRKTCEATDGGKEGRGGGATLPSVTQQMTHGDQYTLDNAHVCLPVPCTLFRRSTTDCHGCNTPTPQHPNTHNATVTVTPPAALPPRHTYRH